MSTSNESTSFDGMSILMFGMAVFALVGALTMAYKAHWNAQHASFQSVYVATQTRLDERNEHRVMDGVQNQAIQRNVATCLPSVLSETLNRHTDRDLPLNQFNADAAAQDAEQVCTTRLLDSVAVSNPAGAQALAVVLQEHHYAISPVYAKAAMPNATALASVHL